MTYPFQAVARLAQPEDNCAIATRNLESGTNIRFEGDTLTLKRSVLEGHRFAVRPVAQGEYLLSWHVPFGRASVPIAPGEYLCNPTVLENLITRKLGLELPEMPNFVDEIPPLDKTTLHLTPAPPVARYADPASFSGYLRPGGRGAGTRNTIVLLGTSSLTGSFVRELEARLRPLANAYPYIDDIVAVAHTEGAYGELNNRDMLLRTLAGFMVHPNVGAVLAIDEGAEAVNNVVLETFMATRGYPLAHVPHHFMSRSGSFTGDLATAERVVAGWLTEVNACERQDVPLSHLKVALQCGGSDAFSGISGNPLVAWVAREIIRHGGSANLAETDELIGAEAYLLNRVRNKAVGEKFLATLERFNTWAARHGHSAAGNPSGGNVLRGLYNIYLKSLGAAMKRPPDVPLDAVIDYAEPMSTAGYTFMDSPGNDLESVAGQVASGCNLIYFVTGNGSITNFPFVPTLKVVTTSERYRLLSKEMDVNAGAYLEGRSMDALGLETFALSLKVASGKRSVGEAAGHAQVQIWRNWQLSEGSVTTRPPGRPTPTGEPIPLRSDTTLPERRFSLYRTYRTASSVASQQLGLVLPTSLCAGQVGRLIVGRLNEEFRNHSVGGFVSLLHTEGCGGSGSPELVPTLLGHATHPLVRHALLLEHGCEKTHNAYFRERMEERGVDTDRFGWASIQLDGGIAQVSEKVSRWFAQRLAGAPALERVEVGLEALRIGLMAAEAPPADVTRGLARLVEGIVAAGGTVVVPEQAHLQRVLGALGVDTITDTMTPSLSYAQSVTKPGFHLMDGAGTAPHWVETLTGLGATGTQLILAYVGDGARQGHPFVPVLQVSDRAVSDVDLVLSGEAEAWVGKLLDKVVATLEGSYRPNATKQGNVDFQLTRGALGVSL